MSRTIGYENSLGEINNMMYSNDGLKSISDRDVRRRRPVPLPRAHVQNPLHQPRPVRRVMRRRAVQHERPVIRAKKDNA